MGQPQFKTGKIIELEIESLTNQGSAIARSGGFVFFVDFAAPGDLIQAEITKVKKTHGFARLVEVLEASSDRVEPPCQHFGICGGCDWQHLSYEAQLRAKQKIVGDALVKLAKMPNHPSISIEASPKKFNYRNRVQLQLKNGRPGYFQKASHKLVKITHCDIADAAINKAIKETSFDRSAQKIDIRLDHSRHIIISADVKNQSFQQVNGEVNSLLLKYVQNIISRSNSKRVLDLYCGQGNFSLPAAQACKEKQVIASDSNAGAIASASRIAEENSIENVKFICQDSRLTLQEYKDSDALVIIDPPRAGCSKEFIESLIENSPNELVYISCDPATLARDLRLICEGLPLKVASLRCFDMFPQTAHVETVAHLVCE